MGRVENQLIGSDILDVRATVDTAYERIVQSMFDSLKQMAKMEGGEGEDKGQLNYHVELVGESCAVPWIFDAVYKLSQRICITLSPKLANRMWGM